VTAGGASDAVDAEGTRLDHEVFWTRNQPGFRFARARPGTPEFFAEVERHRYEAEPHIPEVVRFEGWTRRDVLEVGCGIATDGLLFARAGARYTGTDLTAEALALARRRFELEGLDASFVRASAERLPFPQGSFDLVYSHGVLHHLPNTEAAVGELHRVLRPGGTALVMLYHRRSLNYMVTIMVVRRALAASLLLPAAPRVIAQLTGEQAALLEQHRSLLRTHGARYLTDSRLFLSHNTDGPGNPLSKVYSRDQARTLFRSFAEVRTQVRFLNLRLYPGVRRMERSRLGRALGSVVGWHLYVEARKAR
jgi:ubiquinone/menaquinone biosynthesis C-methylase UbiE